MYNRLASLLVAGGYLIAIFLRPESNASSKAVCVLAVVVPLPLIWFGEAFGSWVGPADMGYINRPTPGVFVAIGGWLLLIVVPLVLLLTP